MKLKTSLVLSSEHLASTCEVSAHANEGWVEDRQTGERPVLGATKAPNPNLSPKPCPYLWLVGNGRMVAIVVIIVPHSSIPY